MIIDTATDGPVLLKSHRKGVKRH